MLAAKRLSLHLRHMTLFSEVFQRRILTACLWIGVLIAILSATLIGAEYDEIWILSSARQAFDPTPNPIMRAVTTSGGRISF